jgi:hypothetical protein
MVSSYANSSGAFSQANDTLPGASGDTSFLIKSTTDQKVWLINQGAKSEITFPMQVSFGHLSTPRHLASASNTFLDALPSTTTRSFLIRKAGSGGVKFVNFGRALGFPDGDTLVNTISATNPVIVVDDFIFDSIPLTGSLTKIIKDDAGKLYVLQSGERRWLTSSNAYQPYSSIPITYLYGTTMALIPEGATIN